MATACCEGLVVGRCARLLAKGFVGGRFGLSPLLSAPPGRLRLRRRSFSRTSISARFHAAAAATAATSSATSAGSSCTCKLRVAEPQNGVLAAREGRLALKVASVQRPEKTSEEPAVALAERRRRDDDRVVARRERFQALLRGGVAVDDVNDRPGATAFPCRRSLMALLGGTRLAAKDAACMLGMLGYLAVSVAELKHGAAAALADSVIQHKHVRRAMDSQRNASRRSQRWR